MYTLDTVKKSVHGHSNIRLYEHEPKLWFLEVNGWIAASARKTDTHDISMMIGIITGYNLALNKP